MVKSQKSDCILTISVVGLMSLYWLYECWQFVSADHTSSGWPGFAFTTFVYGGVLWCWLLEMKAQEPDGRRLERLVLRARQRGYEAAKQEYEARQQKYETAYLAFEREKTALRREQQECQRKQLRLEEGIRWVKEEERRLQYLREEQTRLEQEIAWADAVILEKEKEEELWQSQEEVGFENDYDPDNEHDPSVDYGPGDDITEEEGLRGSDYERI